MDRVLRTTKKDFSSEDILSVVRRDNLAIHISKFCGDESLSAARSKLSDHKDRGNLRHANEFGRIGFAYSEINDDETRRSYHANALSNLVKLREIFAPYASPIDELRLVLDEKWPMGAQLMHINGQKCFVGICRYQDINVDLNPHIDKLERNLPQNYQVQLSAQLSVNIYMNIPTEGGELELWDIEPTEECYKDLVGGRHYGIDRNKLPSPTAVVKPEAGDLILLNPRLIHAVRPSKGSSRITLGVFVGFMGESRPLTCWS